MAWPLILQQVKALWPIITYSDSSSTLELPPLRTFEASPCLETCILAFVVRETSDKNWRLAAGKRKTFAPDRKTHGGKFSVHKNLACEFMWEEPLDFLSWFQTFNESQFLEVLDLSNYNELDEQITKASERGWEVIVWDGSSLYIPSERSVNLTKKKTHNASLKGGSQRVARTFSPTCQRKLGSSNMTFSSCHWNAGGVDKWIVNDPLTNHQQKEVSESHE